MKLTVAAVGKVKSKHYAAACNDYTKRLSRYGTFKLSEVKDCRGQPPAVIAAREAAALDAAVPTGAFRVVLDERGELVSSMALAKKLERAALHGTGSWAFCVGGGDGHDPEFRNSADWVWSLSPLTLPHELARVVLLEQLYRAMTIIRGEGYHREG